MKNKTITQKQKNILLLVMMLTIFAIQIYAQQDGFNRAADSIKGTVLSLKEKVSVIVGGCGFIFAAIGLAGKMLKSGTDQENTGKAYTTWFVNVGLGALALGTIGFFFS